MKTDTEFIDLMRQTTYFMLYFSLMEMGASPGVLKAFEEYQKADLQGMQTAGAWVREWQQAKLSEALKKTYLSAERQRQQQEKLYNIAKAEKMFS